MKLTRAEALTSIVLLAAVFVVAAASLVLPGCASQDTNFFRGEQTAVNLGHAAYTGWTNYLNTHQVSAESSNAVRTARLRFAATVGSLESIRAASKTNGAAAAQVPALASAVTGSVSNFIWTVEFAKGEKSL